MASGYFLFLFYLKIHPKVGVKNTIVHYKVPYKVFTPQNPTPQN